MNKVKSLLLIIFLLAVYASDAQESAVVSDKLTIYYGADDTYAPFEFVDSEGQLKGFQIELMQAVARIMDLDIVFSSDSWSNQWRKFTSSDSINVVGMFYSPSRAEIADFINPHTVVSHQIIQRIDGNLINSLKSLKAKNVVVEGSSLVAEEILASNLGIVIFEARSEIDAMEQLAAGKYDAAIISQYQSNIYIEESGNNKIKPTGPLIFPLDLSFATKKGNKEILESLTIGMQILKNTGEYTTIYTKWFGEEGNMNYLEKNWKWILSILLVLFISIWLWIKSLGHLVAKKTAQLKNELYSNEKTQKVLSTKNNELEKKNLELDSFMYKSSHDLVSPLKSIRGLVNIAKIESTTEKQRSFLDMINSSISQLEQFMSKIMNYAVTKNHETAREKIVFGKLVDEILLTLKYYENANRIEVVQDFQESAVIISDPVRLIIIMSNLITNSIKYHNFDQHNPYIKISLARVDNRNIIKVEDNGIGIAGEHFEKIYEMFYRASSRPDGSGLGLFIVKDAVTKLGGTIDIESTLEKSTCFTISLPLTKEHSSKQLKTE